MNRALILFILFLLTSCNPPKFPVLVQFDKDAYNYNYSYWKALHISNYILTLSYPVSWGAKNTCTNIISNNTVVSYTDAKYAGSVDDLFKQIIDTYNSMSNVILVPIDYDYYISGIVVKYDNTLFYPISATYTFKSSPGTQLDILGAWFEFVSISTNL